MNITEAINKLNIHKVFNGDYAEAIEIVVNELLRDKAELQWYREQDIIRREDAINEIIEIANYYKEKGEYLMEYSVLGCANALGILPKAEPPKEDEQ